MNISSTGRFTHRQLLRAKNVAHPVQKTRTPTTDHDGLNVVAFFPGLGSRSAYHDVDAASVHARV